MPDQPPPLPPPPGHGHEHGEDAVACVPRYMPRAGVDDEEGEAVPPGLRVFDSHVHLFPPGVFDAIWRWFDEHAWPVRYRLHAEEVIAFLKARGVRRFCALHYAHKPGMAAALNRFVWSLSRSHPEVVPIATVYPGEPDAERVLEYALGELGMRGVKLHCHVQKMAADDARFELVYKLCEEARVPVVIHAGREPSSPAYGVDTRALCSALAVEKVLRRHPRLTVVVPHLGADEFVEYARLLKTYGNLWLDTTMAIADFFPGAVPTELFPAMADRMLYGTDFPNIPYAWDRELKRLLTLVPDDETRDKVLWSNAAKLFGE